MLIVIIIRGNTYAGIDQVDLAIKDYTVAIQLKSDYVDAYYYRGSTYDKKGEIDKAIEDFSTAIKLDPKLVIAYYYRAGLTAKNRNFIGQLKTLIR